MMIIVKGQPREISNLFFQLIVPSCDNDCHPKIFSIFVSVLQRYSRLIIVTPHSEEVVKMGAITKIS
jgi:hypothetical protein